MYELVNSALQGGNSSIAELGQFGSASLPSDDALIHKQWHPPMILDYLSSERPTLGITTAGFLTLAGGKYNLGTEYFRLPGSSSTISIHPLDYLKGAPLQVATDRANVWARSGLGLSVAGQLLGGYSYVNNMRQGNYSAARMSALDFGVGALTFSSSITVAVPVPLLYFSYRAGAFDNMGKGPIKWHNVPF